LRASLAVLIVAGCLIHGLGTFDTVPKWLFLYTAAAVSVIWFLVRLWRERPWRSP